MAAEDALLLDEAGPIPAEHLRSVATTRPAREPESTPAVTPSATAAVPILRTAPARRLFDAYIMVDWSSSSQPTRLNAADSIWLGLGRWDGDLFQPLRSENHQTRAAARARIDAQVRAWLAEERRVLVGLDFAFGYPRGFARSLGLTGAASWRSIHDYFRRSVIDGPTNSHNGANLADACNRVVAPAGPGPFWGCHANAQTPLLTSRRVGLFTFTTPGKPGTYGLAEWRLTDNAARSIANPQSVWKLNCGVSVGMQTITGIKHLSELRAGLEGAARIWPFETGFEMPSRSEAWFAEIFPSLLKIDPAVRGHGGPRDREQVETCVFVSARHDSQGTMAAVLRGRTALSSVERSAVLDEEGWMLFLN